MTTSIIDIASTSTSSTNSKYLEVIAIQQSQNWSPEKDCIADIVVIGAGGGGTAHEGAGSYGGTGGGAGGFCKKSNVTLISSDVNVLTVGAGGQSAHAYNGSRTGSGGGTSSFSGSSLSLIARGGYGGVTTTSSTPSKGRGGTAEGGDINLKGGDTAVTGAYQASGGANVNVGFGAQDANVMNNHTAGAGKGVLGGDAGSISPKHSSLSSRIGGKGASYIPNLDFLGLINVSEASIPFAPGYHSDKISKELKLEGQPSIGVGGSGQAIHATEAGKLITVAAQNGGWFAGGGATNCAQSGSVRHVFIAGSGMFGGGGGAAICLNDAECFGGRGGDGVIFIAIKEYL